jgi:hypothetical protein
MIPRIIHYCWLSGDPFPSKIKKCITSWKKHLKDYEFKLWDTRSFDLNSSLWVKQAFECKKYAFAADYIRVYALYHFGGIYLDSDVEVLKSFDDLLSFPYFACTEGNNFIEAGAFGSEAKQEWLKECLDYYVEKEFIKSDGSLDTLPLPQVMMQQIQKKYDIQTVDKQLFISQINNYSINKVFYMLPKEYFCAKDMGSGVLLNTKETYCIHHFEMSWIPMRAKILPNIKRKLIKVFGEKFIYQMINLLNLKVLFRKSENG